MGAGGLNIGLFGTSMSVVGTDVSTVGTVKGATGVKMETCGFATGVTVTEKAVKTIKVDSVAAAVRKSKANFWKGGVYVVV